MILSDTTIKNMLQDRSLVVDPINDLSIQPASIDCRIGKHYLLVDHNNMGIINMSKEIKYKELENDTITLPAHSFILATTIEYIELPNNLTAFVEGRSSIGRLGLFIQNAGWVDPGFKGNITLELYNANSLPIKLQAGRRVCQLVFCKMDNKAETPYTGKYQGQTKAVGSMIYKDI